MQPWTFTSYEKIVEDPAQWQFDEAGYRVLAKSTWVVTEKIHGANFCFITDGKSVRCANRKKMLQEHEDFFSYQSLLAKLQEKIKQIFFATQTRNNFVQRIYLYGELFGGSYPHPAVSVDATVQPVQTGVYYSPHIEFCAFDLALESNDEAHSRSYLDYESAIEIFQFTDLLYAVPLFLGSYQDVLNYPIGFPSTLPTLLGLPPLPEMNRAEGIVIKPLKNLMLSTKKGLIRPVLKKKIAEFAEDKRFHLAEKWTTRQASVAMSNLELLKWEVYNLVTMNRLDSAISKLGQIKRSERGKEQHLFRAIIEDIQAQLEQNQEEAYATLEEQERDQLILYIKDEVRALLKKYFQKGE